jgi:hypothetical protein
MHWVLFVAGSFWNSNMWSLDPVDPPSTTYSFCVLFCLVCPMVFEYSTRMFIQIENMSKIWNILGKFHS